MENTDKVDIGLIEVNSERQVELPEIEKTDIEKYLQDARRYSNAIIEDYKGLPDKISSLDEISARQLLFFTQDKVNPWTGKRTLGNVVESYMMSGAYTDEYLNKHFKKEERKKLVKVEKGNFGDIDGEKEFYETVTEYKINHKIYQKIELEAFRNWNSKELSVYVLEVQKLALGNMSPEDLIKFYVNMGIVQSDNSKERLAWIKEGMKIYNMEKSAQMQQINVYVNGGGRELNKTIVESSGNDNYNLD